MLQHIMSMNFMPWKKNNFPKPSLKMPAMLSKKRIWNALSCHSFTYRWITLTSNTRISMEKISESFLFSLENFEKMTKKKCQWIINLYSKSWVSKYVLEQTNKTTELHVILLYTEFNKTAIIVMNERKKKFYSFNQFYCYMEHSQRFDMIVNCF